MIDRFETAATGFLTTHATSVARCIAQVAHPSLRRCNRVRLSESTEEGRDYKYGAQILWSGPDPILTKNTPDLQNFHPHRFLRNSHLSRIAVTFVRHRRVRPSNRPDYRVQTDRPTTEKPASETSGAPPVSQIRSK